MTLVASALLLVSLPALAAASPSGSADIIATVSFRSGPSTSADVLKYLRAGESVYILETPNSYWYKVRDDKGNIGYISSQEKYVNYEQPEKGLPEANAIVVSSVNFRTAPSTDGSRIRYLQKDEQIVITSVVNKYWYAVTDAAGASGFVSSSEQYIKLVGALPQSPTTPSEPAKPVEPAEPAVPSKSQQIEQMIAAGLTYLGTPYEFGSDRNTTTTFDCSDFVRQAFRDALDVTLPADSRQQGDYVRNKNAVSTDWHSLKRGDLMFFMAYKDTKASSYAGKRPFDEKISHVGIYLGDGQVLHTYSVASGGVRIDNISGKHWEYRFLYGGSAL